MDNAHHERLRKAVIRVGDGRGFIVATQNRQMWQVIVTAAHCLPHLPAACSARFTEEVTYPRVLGGLLDDEATVSAECLFVDPIADIAVMGRPDYELFGEEARRYEELISDATRLRIGPLTKAATTLGFSLMLDGNINCMEMKYDGNPPSIYVNTAQPIVPGMSGSPIVDMRGTAVSLVTAASESGTESGPNPSLLDALPGWLSKQFMKVRKTSERRASSKL